MRKFLVICAAVVLVAALMAPSLAQAKTDIKFKGDIRYRGWTMDNLDRNDAVNDSQQAMDTRGRIKMTASQGDDLYGVFYWEMGDAYIGEEDTTLSSTGNQGGLGTTDDDFRNDNDQRIVEVKQMYIGAKLPWNKAFEFQVGGVPAYDIPKGLLFGADAAGLKAKYEFKGGKIIVWYYKDKESIRFAADRDYMGGIAFYNITKDIRIGAHVSYLNDRFNKIGTNVSGGTLDQEANDTGDQLGISSQIWWFGGTAEGKVPLQFPLKFTADVIFMDGETEADKSVTSGQYPKDITGFMADVTLSTEIGPVTLEGFFSYASGDDNPTDEDAKIWRNVETGKENFRRLMIVNGYSGFDSGALSDSNGDFLAIGYNGLMIWGGSATYKPTSKIKLKAQVAWVGMAEDPQLYNPVYPGYYTSTSYPLGTYGSNKHVGTEVDIIADYKLYKNLNLRGLFAYMYSGDAYKHTVLVDHIEGPGVGAKDPNDPWFVGYNLTYKF
jgi:hypothetical protein